MEKNNLFKQVREIIRDGNVVATGGFMGTGFAGKTIISLEKFNVRDQRSHLFDSFL